MSKENSADLSRRHDPSLLQKSVFWGLHLCIVGVCAWLAFFGGIETISAGGLRLSDPTRALILFLCATLYAARHGITLFYLLVRQVPWGEVVGLLVFMALFEIGLLVLGAGAFRDTAIALNWLDGLALVLLLVGSYVNSASEIQRKWWKNNPANKGHCYTKGLFRHSMHINFFGDVVLFTGWCLFTHNFWTLGLPALMAASFIFYHIPGLDRYLADRYGDEFATYAAKTKKLVPFIY